MKELSYDHCVSVSGGWWTRRQSSGGQMNRSRPRHQSDKARTCTTLNGFLTAGGGVSGLAGAASRKGRFDWRACNNGRFAPVASEGL